MGAQKGMDPTTSTKSKNRFMPPEQKLRRRLKPCGYGTQAAGL
jgi:hypothetical protein